MDVRMYVSIYRVEHHGPKQGRAVRFCDDDQKRLEMIFADATPLTSLRQEVESQEW